MLQVERSVLGQLVDNQVDITKAAVTITDCEPAQVLGGDVPLYPSF